jgi:thymidylate synthase
MPWAEDHFRERVCGYPINPGTEWQNWPYAKSAQSFLDDRGKFNHNYMERYWPKIAGLLEEPTYTAVEFAQGVRSHYDSDYPIRHGILYDYGDLSDVIDLLATDPYTRQAYLPVWFPEDTGGGSKRAPCTIGYHFLMRDGKLDINYHIRSCDFVRHFRDDLYLTVRLLLQVLEECRKINEDWNDVSPGLFIMQIGSLHIFRNDYIMLFGNK